MTPDRQVVGVFPRHARASRGQLFDALERCFPVRFEGRDEGSWRALDAALVLPGSERSEAPPALPQLVAAYEEEAVAPARGRVELSSSELLDSRIRGRSLDDERAGAVAVAAAPTSSILASHAQKPVWTAGRIDGTSSYSVSVAPEELRRDERLRDRLRPGRFLALLPLVQFLREVGGPERWMPPPLRASIVLDDPNLHWPSYGLVRFGLIRFAELTATAQESRFHAAIAMVPLDGWCAHPRPVALFREKPAWLSVVMRGNDHVKRELAQALVDAERAALTAQVLRRVAAFEQRTGIPVTRVMTPPHGAGGEAMMQTSAASSRPVSGRPFEPIAVTRPARIELTLVSPSAIEGSGPPDPRRRLWPVLRRIAVETRDRLLPLVPSRGRA